jgi:hypothetical protein
MGTAQHNKTTKLHFREEQEGLHGNWNEMNPTLSTQVLNEGMVIRLF